MPRRKEPRIPDAVLDQLLAGADPNTVFDLNGWLHDLSIDMFPEDGRLWVYGVDEDGVSALHSRRHRQPAPNHRR